MIIELLHVMRNNPNYSKTRIVASANWSIRIGVKAIRKLNHQGFCELASDGRRWILTEKGKVWLRQIEPLIEQVKNV